MTREGLKRQVLAVVKVRAEFSGLAETVLNGWLKGYREGFNFGPASVLSAMRELRRELDYAQSMAHGLRGDDTRRP
jgi:hypothetical protein